MKRAVALSIALGVVIASGLAVFLAMPRAHRVHSIPIPGHQELTVDFIQYASPLQPDGPIHVRIAGHSESKLPYIEAGECSVEEIRKETRVTYDVDPRFDALTLTVHGPGKKWSSVPGFVP